MGEGDVTQFQVFQSKHTLKQTKWQEHIYSFDYHLKDRGISVKSLRFNDCTVLPENTNYLSVLLS